MTGETELTLVRRIRAPVARVYAAWTDPALLALWWGPHHTRVESADLDVRVGGAFRTVLREGDGARHEVSGVYAVIEPGRQLVFSWAWAATPERQSRVTVTFRALADETEVTVRHDRFADRQALGNHRRGWTESLDRLGALGPPWVIAGHRPMRPSTALRMRRYPFLHKRLRRWSPTSSRAKSRDATAAGLAQFVSRGRNAEGGGA